MGEAARKSHATAKTDQFTDKLRRLVDPGLVCYWNPFRERYVIDRCTHPEASSGLHRCTITCSRTNVLVVQGDDKEYRDLSDGVIDDLRAMDTWSNFGSVEAMDAAEKSMEDADATARAKAIEEAWENIRKDNRSQLYEAYSLIKTHDMSEIH